MHMGDASIVPPTALVGIHGRQIISHVLDDDEDDGSLDSGTRARRGFLDSFATECIIHRLCEKTWYGAIHGSMAGLQLG